MSSSKDEWTRIEPLLDRALELTGRRREEFLDQLQERDPASRAALDKYLSAARDTDELVIDRPLSHVAGDLLDRVPLGELDGVLPEGERLGGYRIVEELGSGGMGRVYRAVAGEPDAPAETVAVKVLNRSRDRADLRFRFHRERRILAELDHPSIVPLLADGLTADQRPYFVMRFVDGDPLTTYCTDNGLPLEERLTLFLQVCDAVQHAHAHGVVHRDLKPTNILVEASADGGLRAFVLDFGIARGDERRELTLTGQIIGTPGYMSPEQARGETSRVDRRCDVFSLGALLYELLCGQRPFQGKNPAETLIKLIDEDPPPLTEMDASVPLDLDRIVVRCLAKEPGDRYRSVRDLADDLRHFLEGRSLEQARILEIETASTQRRRWGRLQVVVGVLLVVIVLLLAVLAVQERRRRQSRVRHDLELLEASWSARTRAAQLVPLHDLRRAQESIELQLLTREERWASLSAWERGWHARALGLGWAALGESRRADRYLNLAVAAGTWDASVALELLRGVHRRCQAELDQFWLLPAPVLRAALREELVRRCAGNLQEVRRLGDPPLGGAEIQLRALELVAMEIGARPGVGEAVGGADGGSPDGGSTANIASTGDVEALDRLLDEDPWRLELLELQGLKALWRSELWRSEEWRSESAAPAAIVGAVEAALRAFRRQSEQGRSDPMAFEQQCRSGLRLARLIAEEERSAAVRRGRLACQESLIANPDRPWPRILLASASLRDAEQAEPGSPTRKAALDEAVRQVRRGVASDPRNPEVYRALAAVTLEVARVRGEAPLLSEAAAAVQRATELEAEGADQSLLPELGLLALEALILQARIEQGALSQEGELQRVLARIGTLLTVSPGADLLAPEVSG